MAHIYTVAITILADVESSQPLSDSQIRKIMDECDYSVSGDGHVSFDFYRIPYRVTDTEMVDYHVDRSFELMNVQSSKETK